MKEYHNGKSNDGILLSNMKHDMILYFLFTKMLIKQFRDKVDGDILNYIDLSIDEFIFRFSSNFK